MRWSVREGNLHQTRRCVAPAHSVTPPPPSTRHMPRVTRLSRVASHAQRRHGARYARRVSLAAPHAPTPAPRSPRRHARASQVSRSPHVPHTPRYRSPVDARRDARHATLRRTGACFECSHSDSSGSQTHQQRHQWHSQAQRAAAAPCIASTGTPDTAGRSRTNSPCRPPGDGGQRWQQRSIALSGSSTWSMSSHTLRPMRSGGKKFNVIMRPHVLLVSA